MATPIRSQRLVRQLSTTATFRPTSLAGFTTRSLPSQHRPKSTNTNTSISKTRPSPRAPFLSSTSRSFASSTTPEETTTTTTTTIPDAPDTTNHYTIFPSTLPQGPPPGSPFTIPVSDLRREFLRLQAVVHPDKFSAGPAKQRAEQLSARINEAYRTLRDPLLRAQYLLREWHGIDVTAEDAASSTRHALDFDALSLIMDVQEAIEEAANTPDPEKTIAQLKMENDERVAKSVQALGSAFDAGDIDAATRECVRLRFWYSVDEGLRGWEPGSTEIRLVH